MQGVNKGETPSQAAFTAELFGVAIQTPQDVRLHTHQTPPGFFATQPIEGLCCKKAGRNVMDVKAHLSVQLRPLLQTSRR
jgi:hypothetical protein